MSYLMYYTYILASRYNIDRLVYCESNVSINAAIAREKKIKNWRREKRIALIVSKNPLWKDLSDGWYD